MSKKSAIRIFLVLNVFLQYGYCWVNFMNNSKISFVFRKTPKASQVTMEFACPHCSNESSVNIESFHYVSDEMQVHWVCPLCHRSIKYDKKDIRKSVFLFYDGLIRGYERIANPRYTQKYTIYDTKVIEKPQDLKSRIYMFLEKFRIKKNHLETLGILPARRFVKSLFREIYQTNFPQRYQKRFRRQQYKAILQELPYRLSEKNIMEAMAIARLLYPLAHIRFGYLYSSRFGHFTANTLIYIRENLHGFHDTIDYFHIDTANGCSNYFWLDIISRMISVLPEAEQLIYRKAVDDLSFSPDFYSMTKSTHFFSLKKFMDNSDLTSQIDISLPFTEAENLTASQELAKMGIPENVKIACLNVRDCGYLLENAGHERHYRNVDINRYRKAAEFLAEQGFYILRMGVNMARSIEWGNGRIVDYASRYRSELMDIWLLANSCLTVTSGSGPDALPVSLGKHVLYMCITQPEFAPFFHDNISIHFISASKKGRKVGVEEFLADNPHGKSDFDRLGYTVEHNTPEEILEAVKEKLHLMNGGRLSADDMRLQHVFRKLYAKYVCRFKQSGNIFPYLREPLHGPLRGFVSSAWLQQHRDELNNVKI